MPAQKFKVENMVDFYTDGQWITYLNPLDTNAKHKEWLLKG